MIIQIPDVCPSCGETLSRTESELFCTNHFYCPAQNTKRVLNFASAMKLKGLGEKSVEKLFDLGVCDIVDLLNISEDVLVQAMGQANGKKIMLELQKLASDKELSMFIQGIGIKGIGESSSKIIAKAVTDFGDIKVAISTPERNAALLTLLGQVKHQNLVDFVQTTMFTELAAIAPKFKNSQNIQAELPPTKGVVCITGKLLDFPNRKSAEEYLATLGWVAKSSVTKEVTHLICEDPTKHGSSSYKKAQSKGIPIVTIKDLESLS